MKMAARSTANLRRNRCECIVVSTMEAEVDLPVELTVASTAPTAVKSAVHRLCNTTAVYHTWRIDSLCMPTECQINRMMSC